MVDCNHGYNWGNQELVPYHHAYNPLSWRFHTQLVCGLEGTQDPRVTPPNRDGCSWTVHEGFMGTSGDTRTAKTRRQEGRVNQRQEKLRVGTDSSQCQAGNFGSPGVPFPPETRRMGVAALDFVFLRFPFFCVPCLLALQGIDFSALNGPVMCLMLPFFFPVVLQGKQKEGHHLQVPPKKETLKYVGRVQ